ncbi:hypothetical protein PhaeoP97_01737 [Phaeobacter porticola]|uniref:Uncharacterized protein n=1 Tax=Phaeobacter porticola TaxID=1844006 RepID=A0A1L3I538_9RHOB|nr:hypothetical protein PhaeoP97_01737 [Phaeobacter porticola]
MRHALHQFEWIEGDCFELDRVQPKQPANQPQNNPEKWLASVQLEKLREFRRRQFTRPCLNASARPRSAGARGAHRTPARRQDTASSCRQPACRSARGRVSGARGCPARKARCGNRQQVILPEQAYQNDAKFEADLELARWRHEVIRPLLALEKAVGRIRSDGPRARPWLSDCAPVSRRSGRSPK